MSEQETKRKVALVTGGSRGIGKAVARKLAGDGCTVYVNYRSREDEARKICDEIAGAGQRAQIIPADVSDSKQVKAMIDQIVAQEKKIDVLVNNAGIYSTASKGGAFLNFTKEEDWWEVVRVNLGGVMNCCKAVLPHMIQRKYGKIINMSSVSGIRGTAGNTSYSASKAAIIGFSKALAREVVRLNITVNCVAPGFIETDMTSQLPENVIKGMMPNIPIQRMGRIEEVAELVSMLASDRVDYFVGQVMVVDGGITI